GVGILSRWMPAWAARSSASSGVTRGSAPGQLPAASSAPPAGAAGYASSSCSDQLQDRIALSFHVLWRDERLEVEAQKRLGVGGAHVEVPLGVVDRDSVEPGDLAIGVALGKLTHLRLLIRHLGVDLSRDE